jgi:lysophospholipase L1-like esterase
MVRFLTTQTLALAMLVAPLFGGNDKNFTYLALGDSIAFGFDPTLMPSQPPFPAPDKFIGYPERVAESLHLLQSKKEVNAACPGETSGSFLTLGAPDNGCQGFKAAVGLHTAYPGIAQATFAVSELASNKHINLVTLSIGGNDLLLLEYYCATTTGFDACVNTYLPGVLTTYGDNLAKILTAIRANYQGTLILMTSYAPSADPLFVQAIAALNQVMVAVGTHSGVKFADGFTAFQIASAPFQGDPCKAGLLIRLSPPLTSPLTCDVHPSPIGRDVLAFTVLLTNGYK